MTASADRLLALAFDPSVQAADDEVARRILDGALQVAAASGLRHLTMDEVARRSRVGRMTVYRRFGNRTALVDALAVRECRRCLAQIASAIDSGAPASERLASLFTATLTVIREHPLLERLARAEPEALLHELNRDRSAVFRLVREFLRNLVIEGQEAGELIAGDPDVLAELGIRLGASFVLITETALPLEDEEATREAVRGLLVPLAPIRSPG
jgi:AcrR family transcriptional regulator